jgi:DNA processing protein
MNRNDDLVSWLKLSLVKGIGPSRLLKLLALYGTPSEIYKVSAEELLRSRVFSEKMVAEWNKLKHASEDNYLNLIESCKEHHIDILPLYSADYPKQLKETPSPPKTLFIAGDKTLFAKRKIAIIGTRHPEQKAIEWAENAAKYFVDAGFVIVSGGAMGIDTAAHRGALQKGKTICVFGTGLFHNYPPENADLFNRIRNEGLLVSEHLPNFSGTPLAFKLRNRITSGLSEAVIVVASGAVGGSMTQARIAYEQKIPLFCPSCSLNILPNDGIPHLISDFKAIEIDKFEDVFPVLKRPNSLQSKL